MHKLQLTYFDFPGGRAEPARLAFYIGDIEFEDIRFPFEQFPEVKKSTPLLQVPVLNVEGNVITQSNAITRFAGKLAGLYPIDNYQALLCDEIMDALEDATTKVVATFGMEGDALKRARDHLSTEVLPRYLKLAGERLEQAGGNFFADNRLTIADLKTFVWVRSLNSGHLDHIPADLVEQVAPNLNIHNMAIASLPEVVAFYGE